jgi:signal transduction histidine kinase
MYLFRALAVWLLIIGAESIPGTIRQFFLVPLVGDFTARRIAVFTGMILIFLITYFFIRRINAPSVKSLFVIGVMWVILTVLFEFGLGYLVLGYSRARMFEDYDITRGGLMGFGLLTGNERRRLRFGDGKKSDSPRRGR